MRVGFCGLLFILTAAMAWQALQIEGPAAAYPIVVTFAALFVSACYLAMQVVRRGADFAVANPFAVDGGGTWRLVGFIVIWLAYVAALPAIGFMLATWLALLLSLALLQGRIGIMAALYTAIFTLVLAVLIKIVLYVPVPQGWLDEALELLLYRSL